MPLPEQRAACSNVRAANACRNPCGSCIFSAPQLERDQSPQPSFSQIPESYGANSMDFVPNGFRSSNLTTPATQSSLYGGGVTPGLVRESSVAHSKAQALRAGRLSHCRVNPSGPNHGRKDLDGRGCPSGEKEIGDSGRQLRRGAGGWCGSVGW